jgi:hypothetical protein
VDQADPAREDQADPAREDQADPAQGARAIEEGPQEDPGAAVGVLPKD